MKTILVTGGAGFIGSHLVDYLLAHYPNYQIINLDKLTYAGNLEHLAWANQQPRHHFVQGDITDASVLADLFAQYPIEGNFHLAAESHVDNSIAGPAAFIQTNIVGTFQLLEQARACMKTKPDFRFLHVSTDEVYGSLGQEGFFSETSPYQPNSPYSASKASSDMLVRSYHKTYGLNTVITNCSNNYGPRQHAEKLIPTVIRHALAGKAIPVYGQGTHIRDWLYVTDHCAALDLVFHQGLSGEVYNIGTHHELTNLQMVKSLCHILDELVPQKRSYQDLISFVGDRPGHDFRYAINPQKIQALGWQPQGDFAQHLRKTVHWYCQKIEKPQAMLA